MRNIGGGVIVLTRADWGADPASPNYVGYPRVPADWERIAYHHTVIIDNDATPNLWESMAEVKAKMRQLQNVRPDLGDVPYAFVIFLMADGTIIVCEGRGTRRSAAGIKGTDSRGRYYNNIWLMVALEGDFENFPRDIGRWVSKMNHFAWWIRQEGCHNLRDPFEIHQANEEFRRTACPGRKVIEERSRFAYRQIVEDNEVDTFARTQIKVLIDSALIQEKHLDHLDAQINFLSKVVVDHQRRLDAVDGAGQSGLTQEQLDLTNLVVASIKEDVRKNRARLKAIAEAAAAG